MESSLPPIEMDELEALLDDRPQWADNSRQSKALELLGLAQPRRRRPSQTGSVVSSELDVRYSSSARPSKALKVLGLDSPPRDDIRTGVPDHSPTRSIVSDGEVAFEWEMQTRNAGSSAKVPPYSPSTRKAPSAEIARVRQVPRSTPYYSDNIDRPRGYTDPASRNMNFSRRSIDLPEPLVHDELISDSPIETQMHAKTDQTWNGTVRPFDASADATLRLTKEQTDAAIAIGAIGSAVGVVTASTGAYSAAQARRNADETARSARAAELSAETAVTKLMLETRGIAALSSNSAPDRHIHPAFRNQAHRDFVFNLPSPPRTPPGETPLYELDGGISESMRHVKQLQTQLRDLSVPVSPLSPTSRAESQNPLDQDLQTRLRNVQAFRAALSTERTRHSIEDRLSNRLRSERRRIGNAVSTPPTSSDESSSLSDKAKSKQPTVPYIHLGTPPHSRNTSAGSTLDSGSPAIPLRSPRRKDSVQGSPSVTEAGSGKESDGEKFDVHPLDFEMKRLKGKGVRRNDGERKGPE